MAASTGWGMVGAVVLVGGFYGSGRFDTASNDGLIDATVRSVKVDCFIESGKSKLVEKGSSKQAVVDCDRAPELARPFGYHPSDIQNHMTVSYVYESPVDRTWYRDKMVEQRPGRIPQEGDTVRVNGHRTAPDKSRWTHTASN